MVLTTSSSWLLQLPTSVEDALYSRNDLQIIEEVKPMRRQGEAEVVEHQTRRHLCVPEGLRYVTVPTSSASLASPPVASVDADYLRSLSAAVQCIRNDQYFSTSELKDCLPAADVYAWPCVAVDLASVISARIRWLENTASRMRAETLRRAFGTLSTEVALSGLIPLDDTSEAAMSEEVSCKRFRTELEGKRAGGSMKVTPEVLTPVRGTSGTCGSLWSMNRQYSRKLILKEELPALVRTISKAVQEGVEQVLRGAGVSTNSAPLLPALAPCVVTANQFLALYPSMAGAPLIKLLTAATSADSSRRWYLRTGVAMSFVEMPSIVLVERSVHAQRLSTHAQSKGLASPIEGLTWEVALRNGNLMGIDSTSYGAMKGNSTSLPKTGDDVRRMGFISRLPSASVSSVSELLVVNVGGLSIPTVTVTFAHNYFFLIHGHGVADGIPLPNGYLQSLEAKAVEATQF